MARIMEYVDAALEETIDGFDISRATFDVLATLRRIGKPYRLTQRELMESLMRTSGSVSVRIDALERAGLVRREPGRDDRRSVSVVLTDVGRRLIDVAAPAHLRNEEQLLSGLTSNERKQLVVLLRTWLSHLEAERGEHRVFGIAVVPGKVSLQRRRAVGLPDVPGILVDDVMSGSAAQRAGIRKGDLITAIDGAPIDSLPALRRALCGAAKKRRISITRGAERISVDIR
jgi:DNA-binding MarR family transcriptional regulator